MDLTRAIKAVRRNAYYVVQKTTGHGFDQRLVEKARARADEYLRRIDRSSVELVPRHDDAEWYGSLRQVDLATIDLENRDRYEIARDDVYKRFVADDAGTALDRFGRKGSWVPRGCVLYRDNVTGEYLKIFDSHFSTNGEGRYLQAALEAGCYTFLCPGIRYLVVDGQGTLRGYAIAEGTVLTPYEFECLVGDAYREVVIEVTHRTGFYFYDLEFHNVVRSGSDLSFIDLESVLPVEWYGEGVDFARARLSEMDVGWPLQEKWHSPKWYAEFLDALKQERASGGSA